MAERPACKQNLSARTIGAAFVFSFIALFVLNLPDHLHAFSPRAFLHLPVEIPLLALALVLLPRRIALFLAALCTALLGLVLFLRLGDIGVQSAFQRRFNPYLDVRIFADGWNVFSGAVGPLAASLAVVGAVAAFLAVLAFFVLSARALARLSGRAARAMALAFACVLAVGLALWGAGAATGTRSYADAGGSAYIVARIEAVATAMRDMRDFDRMLAESDGLADSETLFRAVEGRDIVLVFIESYGRSAVEDPRYAPLIGPRLEAVEEELSEAGFAVASGWSRSPTMGGLSWLAHGTFLSGLWVDNQARYDRLMMSDRKSLNRLFREAGWRTAAIMPAITMDWPEGAYYGYDTIFASDDLGYEGKPFNWVTMPDQYTLLAFDRLVRHTGDDRPVMAEIALISSHAPWTPVPELIDWADVGDGSVFDRQATSGDPPAVVWSDRARVRRQYIRTIDYALQTIGDYIARFGEDAVFIVLGDHQPAPLVTGPDASRAVPVHVISRDARLVERFESEGFAPGMTPAAEAPELPMDTMRARVIRIFSETPSADRPAAFPAGVKSAL
ncbi:sulfatase-like hydrolase/transferase [Martelella lutilitoris]|uniref:Sulfatase-like hydrolase/transferase n=1 Tax=Martelella lutilitoris TaxID=2583532 RepID=A0A7T7HJR8_9HYPH|nr:sulfatase-like hydrolase/transferase [Martelella lutilitoris]QQM30466.1 sulfatase-like hydrolase/transferase [Martelella lutilitoris]